MHRSRWEGEQPRWPGRWHHPGWPQPPPHWACRHLGSQQRPQAQARLHQQAHQPHATAPGCLPSLD